MEVPEISVYSADLGGRAPAALMDSPTEWRLVIDFSRPPEEITASLTLLFQESVNERRWVRRRASDDEGETDH